MLAMGFVSFLLLAIAMLTIHIGGIYNQGITLREVNQAGLAISEDLQRTIGAASPFEVDTTKATSRYFQTNGGGRLCVGSHSYAWNYLGKVNVVFPNSYSTSGSVDKPSLVKVVDPDGSLCQNRGESINRTDASELLAVGDRSLVLYDFSISQPSATPQSASQALYAVDFTLGTDGADIVDAANKTCRPPLTGATTASDIERVRQYCAVNQFSIIVRAGNETGK